MLTEKAKGQPRATPAGQQEPGNLKRQGEASTKTHTELRKKKPNNNRCIFSL